MRITFYKPLGPLDADTVCGALGLALQLKDPAAAYEVVKQWTRMELIVAYDWAIREHMRASDNPAIVRRDKPHFLNTLEA